MSSKISFGNNMKVQGIWLTRVEYQMFLAPKEIWILSAKNIYLDFLQTQSVPVEAGNHKKNYSHIWPPP